jgi:hypothetical protein
VRTIAEEGYWFDRSLWSASASRNGGPTGDDARGANLFLMESPTEELLTESELRYPGLRQQFADLKAMAEIPCVHCDSADTAMLVVGVTGRTMSLADLSAGVKLIAHREEPGERWCRTCTRAF